MLFLEVPRQLCFVYHCAPFNCLRNVRCITAKLFRVKRKCNHCKPDAGRYIVYNLRERWYV